MTKNIAGGRFSHAAKEAPVGAVITPILYTAAILALAVFASTATAAKLMVVYVLISAAAPCGTAAFSKHSSHRLGSTWGRVGDATARAVMFEGLDLVISAVTLLTVWVFAGPLAFAVMRSFGFLVLGVFTNWVIVLNLVDLYDRHFDRGRED